MNKGVEILIERMGSNPDEFVPTKPYGNPPPKWREFISAMFARKQGAKGESPFHDLPFLSDEDVEAFHTRLNEIRSDHFTKQVMATLLDTPDDSSHKEDSFAYTHSWESKIAQLQKSQQAEIQARLQHMEQYLEHNRMANAISEEDEEA